MMYWIIFAIAMFAGIAMTVREGIWSNAITLINILISGVVAFGFYSWIVVYLDEDWTSGQHTYWLDFCIIWALFCATMAICRSLTAVFSKTRMRFKHPIDPVGGPIIGILASWVLAAFTLATLHTAPLYKDTLGSQYARTDNELSSASSMTSPDLAWLRFFVRMTGSDALGYANTDKTDWVDSSVRYWVKAYENHRIAFEKAPSFIVKRGGP